MVAIKISLPLEYNISIKSILFIWKFKKYFNQNFFLVLHICYALRYNLKVPFLLTEGTMFQKVLHVRTSYTLSVGDVWCRITRANILHTSLSSDEPRRTPTVIVYKCTVIICRWGNRSCPSQLFAGAAQESGHLSP